MTVPQLPYELWMEIIGNGTYIPGELDYRTYNPFQSPSAYNLEGALAQVLRTRYTFTLVSRFFHKVALPTLYQTLCITNCNQLSTIMRCLDANTTRSRMSPNVQEHGLLVRRIHIAAHAKWSWPKSFADPIPGTVQFPNLIIVSGNGNRLESDEFGDFFRKEFLKRCSAAHSIDGMWKKLLGKDIEFHKNLRSLCSPVWAWPASGPIPDSFKDNVSRIEALTLPNFWPFATVPLTALPSLCALRLLMFANKNLHYVEALGERLTFLDMTVSVGLQINLGMFPNLRTLINSVGSTYHGRCIVHSPHFGLVQVGFSDQSIISHERFEWGMMQFMDKSLFPRLNQIRLIDLGVCWALVGEPVKRWVDQGLDQGIRLEAGDGRLLSEQVTWLYSV